MLLAGCFRKPIYTCELELQMNRPLVESKVLTFQTLGTTSNSYAIISGSISTKLSTVEPKESKTISFTNIFFIKKSTSDTLIATTDLQGYYTQRLDPGEYNIVIFSQGYNKLIIEDVKFLEGEKKELIAKLGHGSGETRYPGSSFFQPDCVSSYDSIVKQQLYFYVDKMPEYPGGNIQLLTFFSKNFTYPKSQSTFQGSIFITFVIQANGKPTHLDVFKKYMEPELTAVEKTAIKVLEKMPDWTPGMCNGKVVPVRMYLPIRF